MISHYHDEAIAKNLGKFEKVGHIVATNELLSLDGFECKYAIQRVFSLSRDLIDYMWSQMAQTMCNYELPDGRDPTGITVCLTQEALNHLIANSDEVNFKYEIIEPERFDYFAGSLTPNTEGIFEDAYIRTPLDTLREYVRFRRG